MVIRSVEPLISAYVHVNAVGGLRFFYQFENAINNNRAAELTLAAFAGAALPITVKVRDVSENVLGNVTGYTLNTDRETIDATSLSDKFRKQYSAVLLAAVALSTAYLTTRLPASRKRRC
jgi:hypothetical protein